MADLAFDPSEAVTFDLAYGHVHMDGAPNRVLVPSDALVEVCEAAGEEATASLGHAIGTAMGRRVAVRVGRGAEDRQSAVARATFELVVEHLAGELALAGLGSLSVERWGKAVVFVLDQSPLGERGDALLGETLQAAMQALSNQAGRVVRIERSGVRARFLLVAAAAVEGVRMRLREGQSWGTVLAKLHHHPGPQT
jgi:sarcosine oxidase gamma subunit